jgi:hypothetical protein
VFGGSQITQHRYHCANFASPILRSEGNDNIDDFQIYYNKDCPGIDNPASQNNFPILDTLLSIPFSLLLNLPQLSAIIPYSDYQYQLIMMSSEIRLLWWWDPSPEMIKKSQDIRIENLAANQQDDTPNAKPFSIHHQSRMGTTFLMMQPTTTYGTSSCFNLNQGKSAVERPLAPLILGAPPHLACGVTATDDNNVKTVHSQDEP